MWGMLPPDVYPTGASMLIRIDDDTLSLIEGERFVNETPEEFIASAVVERACRQVRNRTLTLQALADDYRAYCGTPLGPKDTEIGREPDK